MIVMLLANEEKIKLWPDIKRPWFYVIFSNTKFRFKAMMEKAVVSRLPRLLTRMAAKSARVLLMVMCSMAKN